MTRFVRRATWLAVSITVLLANAVSAAPSGVRASTVSSSRIAAIVASFDPYAGSDQRLIVGLVAENNQSLAFGQVEFRLGFAGTLHKPRKHVTFGAPTRATYRAVAGQHGATTSTAARLVAPSVSRGVYGVDAVRFDRPGLWSLQVTGKNGKRPFTAEARFEVAAEPQVVVAGQTAPVTTNPLPGSPGVPASAIDSRADDRGVPDAELHRITVADALSAGKPLMVVVSTPVYCISRFCGPITDTIEQLARQYGGQMNFVHLEVWADFERKRINESAAQWIYRRDRSDANEPWVFVVNASGTVVDRFDNVATELDLQNAVKRQIQ